MSYSGYLIKVGNYTIPLSKIRAESYSVYRNVQDLDSYRDANGFLHRTVLDHVANKVEFETLPLITNVDFNEIMRNIRSNFTNKNERKASVTLYIPELDDYETQDMYMSGIQPNIYYADAATIKYNPIRFSFIGY